MVKIKIFGLLMITFLCNACEFNQSIKKDLTTGAFSRGNGIGCDDVKLQVNGVVQKRNVFIHGEKVNFIFNNIKGLTRVNGKAFPGLSLVVVKNEKDTVIKHQDLFKDMKKGTGISPLQLKASFATILPYENHENHEKYRVLIKIWDKKGEGIFIYEFPFSVLKNELLTIMEQSIHYSNIYLWDETQKMVVVDKKINRNNTFILILEGIDGLEVIEHKVYPSLSIDITDNEGNHVILNPNVLEKYRMEGVDYNTFKDKQIPVTITLPSGQINNPCKLKASLKDLKSERSIGISSELIIE